jgi:hypothetical protein
MESLFRSGLFGYLKTEENSEDKGYIARPTDQRLKFGLLFQDYMPNIPSVKIYLNLVYNTGLPEVLRRSLFVPKPND